MRENAEFVRRNPVWVWGVPSADLEDTRDWSSFSLGPAAEALIIAAVQLEEGGMGEETL